MSIDTRQVSGYGVISLSYKQGPEVITMTNHDIMLDYGNKCDKDNNISTGTIVPPHC